MKIEIDRSNHVCKSASRQSASDAINRTIVKLDLLEPTFLSVPDDQASLYDKLRIATEFAQKLTDNGITLSLLGRRKEAITLGEGARPSLSRIITRSVDIQVDSIKELIKVKMNLTMPNMR